MTNAGRATDNDWADLESFLGASRPPTQRSFARHELVSTTHQSCAYCGGFRWVRNDKCAENICMHCGQVDDGDRIPEAPYNHHRLRESAPYTRIYHFNEVMAAWKCTGPAIPGTIMSRIRNYINSVPIASVSPGEPYRVDRGPLSHMNKRRLVPAELERRHIRQICDALNLKKYAERWVQIKKRLHPEWRIRYPSSSAMYRLHWEFRLVSRAFDRHLYRHGQRRTIRDNAYNSKHALARHNMPHYSWIIQNLLYRQGGRALLDEVSADTFFPVQKTASVRRRLRRMWAHLCNELGWEIAFI